ncbi:MAG: hypothetical protein GWN86_06990 [Desulfobacterales bacterium]|nr:hypothetical protein [Desulfobacterales bacterium]
MTTQEEQRQGRQELRDDVRAIQDVVDLSGVVSSGDAASGSLTGTYPSPTLAADAVDLITEIASALKSGVDATLITGTAGTNGDLAVWDANGDLIDGPTPPTGTIVGTSDSQTLTNKTLTSPVLTTPQINDTSANHQYVFGVSELVDDRTVTLPLLTGNDTFVFNAFAATLTNKTINGDNNTLSNLDHGAEVDNPTVAHGATGAVVGTTNTQTLTNKTLTTPTIASFTNATHDHADAAGGGEVDITDIGGVILVRKSSDEALIGPDTTLQDDNDLTFSIAANEVWLVEVVLFYDSATAADFKMGLNGPSGASQLSGFMALETAATSGTGNLLTAAGSGIGGARSSGGAGVGSQVVVAHWGVVTNGSNAGSITVRWAQSTGDSSTTTVRAGSFLRATRIS